MEITDRQRRMIKILVKSNGFMRVSDIANALKISPRTVRYDIDSIEYYLNQMQIELIRKPRVGISIKNPDKVLDELLKWEKSYNVLPYLNKEERLVYLSLTLAIREEPLSSESLADSIGVSRSAILTDLKELGRMLEEKFNISLIAKKRYGYQLVSDESSLRRLLSKQLLKVLKMDNLDRKIRTEKSIISQFSDSESIQKIRTAIKSARQKSPFWIPYNAYLQVIATVRVIMFRMDMLEPQAIKDSNGNSDYCKANAQFLDLVQLAKEISCELSSESWPVHEIENLAVELMKNNLKLSTDVNKSFDPKLIDTVYDMIRFHQRNEALTTQSVKALQTDLISHLDLTLEKLQLNIPNENQLLEEIKTNYNKDFMMAKRMLEIFDSAYGVKTTDDEAGFITMYLVKNQELSKSGNTKNVLVVCGSGKGASKLLATRIRNNIPRLVVKDIVSVYDIEENTYDTAKIDLIITTVSLNFSRKPVIKVSPIITDKELGQISKILFEDYINLHMHSNESKEISTRIDAEVESALAHVTGMVMVEIAAMLQTVYDQNMIEQKHMNQWGLTLHIIMAIPRWRSGSYNVEADIDKLKDSHRPLYDLVYATLNQISIKFDLRIPEEESIAILRYLI